VDPQKTKEFQSSVTTTAPKEVREEGGDFSIGYIPSEVRRLISVIIVERRIYVMDRLLDRKQRGEKRNISVRDFTYQSNMYVFPRLSRL
jgi:hypothetical protein